MCTSNSSSKRRTIIPRLAGPRTQGQPTAKLANGQVWTFHSRIGFSHWFPNPDRVLDQERGSKRYVKPAAQELVVLATQVTTKLAMD
jgi:hypothetical protein